MGPRPIYLHYWSNDDRQAAPYRRVIFDISHKRWVEIDE
jgi:hypothetical protein